MTKKDLSRAIAGAMGLSHRQAEEIIRRVLNGITAALVTEGRLELRHFGVFEVKGRRPRRGRNPRTGEAADVPARLVVTFKSVWEMKERVGKLTRLPGGGAAAPMPSGVSE